MGKLKTKKQIMELFQDNQTIMVGGFLGVGAPKTLIDFIVEKKVKGLTLIGNDTCFSGEGVGKLISNLQVAKVIATHVGTNPDVVRLKDEGKMEVELVPQGTMAERLRCGGAGLGGVLTPTGVGTIIEEGKEIKTINGKKYLIELPIQAEIALVKAWKADPYGNLVYRRSARNFNPLVAMAGKTVVVEAEEMVGVGEIDPDDVMTPGVFVNMILQK